MSPATPSAPIFIISVNDSLDALSRALKQLNLESQTLSSDDPELIAKIKQYCQHIESNIATTTNLNKQFDQCNISLANANAELEAFAYSVSHDLRAPLHRINGFSEILEDECSTLLTDAGRDYLRQISKGVDQMRSMIDELLKLSQLSQHRLQRESFNLSQFAEQLLNEWASTSKERQVRYMIAPDIRVNADPELIKIALSNLFHNAWKFTRHVPDAIIEFGGNQQNLFYVRDNGVGFDRAKAKRLFTPFQRFHLHSQFEGNGIGLATVQRIIRLHGGQIECHSEPDKGAQFYFSLAPN